MKMKELARPALKVVKDKKIKFHPSRWENIYNHWLNNINDWCISRQLWWGHQIPVWYKNKEIYCGVNPPDGDGWTQDEDVLDTWFSSWIWPLATLGWPNKTKDLDKFYPTQDLVTGPDIIFFWVARMIMAGLYFKKEIPFSNVYFTSIIRDEHGKKMSKSLGNSPDPIELFEEYGVDAVRVSILLIAPQGTDVLFSVDRLEQGRNFMNKLWNSSRFLMMNINDDINIKTFEKIEIKNLESIDFWIISKMNRTIDSVNNQLSSYKLNEAIKTIYNFVWRDFCDWYIEFSKIRMYGNNNEEKETTLSVSVYVLKNILQLLHPYAPFITEEIWSFFKTKDESIIVQTKWPIVNQNMINNEIEEELSFVMNIISSIRNIKSELNISPKKEAELICRGPENKINIINNNKKYFQSLTKIKSILFGQEINKPKQCSTAVVNDVEIFLPLAGLIDIDKEINRLKSNIEDMKGRMNSVKKKLDNKNFINRAPENIVKHEKEKFSNYKNDYDKLVANLESLIS